MYMAYKKFIKDIGILGLTQLVSAFSSIATLPVITKLLGAQNFGIWTQLLITISLVSTIASLNIPYALLRFLAGEKEYSKIQDGVWSSTTVMMITSLVAGTILIIFSKFISIFFGCSQFLIVILAIIIIFECLNQVFYNVLRVFQETSRFSIILVFQELGKAGLVILSVYLGYGLSGALLSFLVIRFIGFLILFNYTLKKVRFKLPKFLETEEYFSFSIPTIFNSISNWIIQSSDKYLVGFFLGSLFVGYYAPAYSISVFVMNFLVAPFSFLLPVILSKFYDENNTDQVKIYLKYSLKYFLLIAIPAVFGLSILSKQILSLLTTPEFAKQGFLVMPIVSLAMLSMGINAILAQIINIIKKTKIEGIIASISAILNLGLNFLFIPWLGIIGAAITTFISFTFLLVATYNYSLRYFKFKIDWLFIVKSIIASSLMALFVFWFNPSGLYKTISAIFLGILIYSILIVILKVFEKKEFILLKGLFKNT